MAATNARETEHPAQAIAEEHPIVETPKQLLVLVFLSFVVPVVILIMLAILFSRTAFDAEHPAMTEQAIMARIKPVGEVVIGEGPSTVTEAPAAAATAGGAAPAGAPAPTVAIPTVPPPAAAGKTAAAGAADGKAVYEKVCAVCHVAGVAGAPKFADKAAWSPRLAQGIEALHATVLKGKGAMPPRGGAASQYSDADIRAAVEYMVGAVK